MPLELRGLSVLAYANRFTLWHLRADRDTVQQVVQPGYFDAASDMLAGGDLIHVTASDGYAELVVRSSPAGDGLVGGARGAGALRMMLLRRVLHEDATCT